MKNTLFAVAVITISLLQFSCGTTVPQLSNRKPYEIDTAYVYHLPSQITSIAKGNRQEFNELYSDSTLKTRSRIFNQHLPVYMTPISFDFTDSYEEQEINKSFFEVLTAVENKRKIKGITLNNSLVSYLEANKMRYVILTFHAGFTRLQGNYGGQIAKGVGIGILTLGIFVPVPVKSNSTIICCVLDTKNKNVAFYRKRTAEVEPLEEKVISRQIKIILDSWLIAAAGR
ncbi:hypothetical protein [Emticicia agri]|uniref:Uncharacterized protein n=1 Tax=Emticicia agri TaxID=2492393 RepID=A0A4Q5LWD5_9BACT|nr:hypothetical protein [Emticicia agri]RYU94012.1 hypothetical protein EWM59_19230 [Emticicia agri]